MSIQFDSKSILIIFFLFLSLFFGYKWYFTSGDKKEYRNKVDQLVTDNKKIIEVRDSLKISFLDLQKKYNLIVETDSLLSQEVIDLRRKVIFSKNKADATMKELERLKSNLEIVNNKIKELENNIIEKTDEQLIESLKNKIRQ
jgi:uncharacterized protein (DUF3084 family)